MARSSIVAKLSKEMMEPISSERQVVYILAEMRKLLELNNEKSKYPALNFYCNWALHSKLSRSSEASNIVTMFDGAEGFLTQLDTTPPGTTIPDLDWSWMNDWHNRIALVSLREELRTFSTANDIIGRLLEDDNEWLMFLQCYGAVIEDCPLICTDDSLQYVKEVIIKKIDIPGSTKVLDDGTVLVFVLEWQWRSPSRGPKATQKIFTYRVPTNTASPSPAPQSP